MEKLLYYCLLILYLVTGTGCQASNSEAGSIQVMEVWARPTMLESEQRDEETASEPDFGPTAVYLTLKNGGPEEDRLIQATTDVARSVEIHESREDGGVMRMSRVDGIDIPAGGEAHLRPGGYHIMLEGVKRPLLPADTFSISLVFEQTGTRTTQVVVKDQ